MHVNVSSEIGKGLEIDPESLGATLEVFIREHMAKLNRSGIVMGLSGGIDSAVTATLCVRAIGADNVLALCMPDQDSSPGEIRDAQAVAEALGIEAHHIDLTPHLKALGGYRYAPLKALPVGRTIKGLLIRLGLRTYKRVAGETVFSAMVGGMEGKACGDALQKRAARLRMKHRLRLLLLCQRADLENRMVVGTANRSEHLVGYCVKHGCDGAADIMPLMDLYKVQVIELARHLGVPQQVIDKPPSPDLAPGLTDERAIGVPYAELDPILVGIERGWDDSRIAEELAAPPSQVAYVRRLNEASAHMRHLYSPGSPAA